MGGVPPVAGAAVAGTAGNNAVYPYPLRGNLSYQLGFGATSDSHSVTLWTESKDPVFSSAVSVSGGPWAASGLPPGYRSGCGSSGAA